MVGVCATNVDAIYFTINKTIYYLYLLPKHCLVSLHEFPMNFSVCALQDKHFFATFR